jgi:hypothetical protein
MHSDNYPGRPALRKATTEPAAIASLAGSMSENFKKAEINCALKPVEELRQQKNPTGDWALIRRAPM